MVYLFQKFQARLCEIVAKKSAAKMIRIKANVLNEESCVHLWNALSDTFSWRLSTYTKCKFSSYIRDDGSFKNLGGCGQTLI